MFGISFPSVGMGQSLPGLNVGEFRAELLGLGRKGQPEVVRSRSWGCPHSSPLFPPEDFQADSSVSPLPLLEAKIHQTHSLARLLTKYAEQLFQEYVSGDGCVGGGPGIRETQIIGLPEHLFSQPHFPVAEIGAPREISDLPRPHSNGRRIVSVPQMPLHPPKLGGSLLGA